MSVAKNTKFLKMQHMYIMHDEKCQETEERHKRSPSSQHVYSPKGRQSGSNRLDAYMVRHISVISDAMLGARAITGASFNDKNSAQTSCPFSKNGEQKISKST